MDAPAPDSGVTQIASLADIPDSNISKVPEPLTLSWRTGDRDYVVNVTTKYPDGDIWAFQVEYLALAEKSKTPQVQSDGTQAFPDEGIHDAHLRQQCIVSPAWLAEPTGFTAFKQKVPPFIVSQLHQELRMVAGMSADFFGRLDRFISPTVHSMLSAASRKGSASSPPTSAPALPPVTSPASTSGADAAPSKSA